MSGDCGKEHYKDKTTRPGKFRAFLPLDNKAMCEL